MAALILDHLGRKMRPRCGKPIRYGIYWGEQVCGMPAGHGKRCLSVEAYKRYLAKQRERNAANHAAKADAINQARRRRYAATTGLEAALAQVRLELWGWPDRRAA